MLKILRQGTQAFLDNKKAITGTDYAYQMMDKQIDTTKGSFKLLTSALTEAAIQISKVLAPLIRDLVDKFLIPMVRAFNAPKEASYQRAKIIVNRKQAFFKGIQVTTKKTRNKEYFMNEKTVTDKKSSGTGRLKGKVAVVTGSAEGIGEATARLFAQEGAKVVVADINEYKGRQVAREVRESVGEAVFIRLDVTSEDNWKSLMIETVEKYSKLNILVNNAGISRIADVENTTLEDWNATMAVNATGVFLGTKHAILNMKNNGELCSIVNRSSIDGQVAEPDLFAYCASKGAVTTLTKSAALSCGAREYTIRVNSVHPAYVHTAMTKGEARGYGISEDEYIERMKAIHPIGVGEPIDVAYIDLFLASDESDFLTGQNIHPNGGLYFH